jgi:hypothetical protein
VRVTAHPGVRALCVAAGSALIVHEILIGPTLADEDSWIMARLAVAVYPAMSMCLLAIAARLAFGTGERSVRHRRER